MDRKLTIFLFILVLGVIGFFIWAQNFGYSQPPPAINYAPNFWFDSEEKYFPCDPLDFYYDKNLNEIPGEIAKQKYDNLSFEEKLNHFKVFYTIKNLEKEWVYEYWLFYVFNDFENEHWGDWESVFVFVDKNTKRITKVNGSAHGSSNELNVSDTFNKHIWVYVGKGSHANCPDEIPDGECGFKWWNFREGKNWSKEDIENGYKVLSLDYVLLSKIDKDFIQNFEEKKSFDKEKSPSLGINISKILGIQKDVYIPVFGSPPIHPWHKPEFDEPEKIRPVTKELVIEKTKIFVENTRKVVEEVTKNTVATIQSTFQNLNPFQAAVAPVAEPGPKPEIPEIETPEKLPISEIVTPKVKEAFPEEFRSQPAGSEREEEKMMEVRLPSTHEMSLVEIQERLDDIAEKIDILNSKVAKKVAKLVMASQPVSEKEPKIPEEEISEIKEPEEIVEEEIEEIEGLGQEVGQEEVGQEFCKKIPGSYSLRNKIIINEVAWMGTLESANNEWIELKNISGSEVNLSGWQLLDKDQQIKIIFPKGAKLLFNGFFLLERTDDDSVSEVVADLIYIGALNNTNEALYLFDENCQLQDEVLANPDWPAGDNFSKRTMERKSDLTWQTSANPGGTPKAENSSGYFVYSGGGGGGGTPPPPPSYPKILISEIQIASENSQKDDFVELYNPNSQDVDLSNWYLQRKTKGAADFSTYAKKDLFSGKKILAKNYFLIANASSTFSADATTTYPLTEDNTLILKNPKGEIVDKVGWGQAQDYETVPTSNPQPGESLGRKWLTPTETYQDTDNNREDFEIQEPTPKAKNKSKVENQPPVASFTYTPQNPFVDDEILFDASSSTDSDGIITHYIWDFGDGNSTTTNQATTTHSYSTSGVEYLVKLTVQDNQGATSTATTTIEVKAHQLAQSVVISEIQIKDKEFVELYNPTDQLISLTGWHLSYFSPGRDWNNPHRNWQFPEGATISAESYYLIGIFGYPKENGNPDADWEILGKTTEKPYPTGQLGNNVGAIAIFSCNPENTTSSEIAERCKVDALAWKKAEETKIPRVKEGDSAFPPPEGKSLGRRKDLKGNYIDSDNNFQDFEIQEIISPTNSKGEKGNILPPNPVEDFQISGSTNNSVTLTWSTTTDPDTLSANLFYKIYYSKEEITEDNLDTTFFATTSATTLTISGLDYNSTYYFAIKAFDGWNYSPLSNVVSYQTAIVSTIVSGFQSDLEIKNNGRKIARASNGTLYVVYFKKEAGISKIFLAKSIDNGKNWQESIVTPDATTTQKNPSIAIDSNDNLHLVWQGKVSATSPYQIRYKKYNAIDNVWSEIENLTNDQDWDQEIPVIAVDSKDNTHLVWVGRNNLYHIMGTNDGGEAETVKPGEYRYEMYSSISYLALAIDSKDNLHLIWQERIPSGWGSMSDSFCYRKLSQEGWSEIKRLASWSSISSIAIDSNDNLHIAWDSHSSGVSAECKAEFYAYYINHIKYLMKGNSWSGVENLERKCKYQISSPSIAVDLNSHLYAVWQGVSRFGYDEIHQNKYSTFTILGLKSSDF